MGYYVLDGRQRIWIEGNETQNAEINQDCKKIYEIIKIELNQLISEGYDAEFVKYNESWILTLSKENEKLISFVLQLLGSKLAVYIYTREEKIFLYRQGFLRKAINIIYQ